MPLRPRARLKCNAGALNQRRIGRLKKRIDTRRAGEPLRGPAQQRFEFSPLAELAIQLRHQVQHICWRSLGSSGRCFGSKATSKNHALPDLLPRTK